MSKYLVHCDGCGMPTTVSNPMDFSCSNCSYPFCTVDEAPKAKDVVMSKSLNPVLKSWHDANCSDPCVHKHPKEEFSVCATCGRRIKEDVPKIGKECANLIVELEEERMGIACPVCGADMKFDKCTKCSFEHLF